jgi:hypothetical protein
MTSGSLSGPIPVVNLTMTSVPGLPTRKLKAVWLFDGDIEWPVQVVYETIIIKGL